MINFENIFHSEGWRFGNYKVSISKNDNSNNVIVEDDPPSDLMSDYIKYLLAVMMKHNKSIFKNTTIHHMSVKKTLRNSQIKAHYEEIKLLKKPN